MTERSRLTHQRVDDERVVGNSRRAEPLIIDELISKYNALLTPKAAYTARENTPSIPGQGLSSIQRIDTQGICLS